MCLPSIVGHLDHAHTDLTSILGHLDPTHTDLSSILGHLDPTHTDLPSILGHLDPALLHPVDLFLNVDDQHWDGEEESEEPGREDHHAGPSGR